MALSEANYMKSSWGSSSKVIALLVLALSAATLPMLLAQKAFAESESAEAERIARFEKKGSGVVKITNGKAVMQGGGGPAVTTTEIVSSQNQMSMLQPQSESALMTAQEKYASIAANGGFPVIPRGSYKIGSKGPAVATLNKRLNLEGYLRVEATQGEFTSLYSNATEEAVRHFQRNMGLAATGRVDGATLNELNISVGERLRTINANIPRLAIYQKDLGDRYLVVNVPAQQLETVSNGRVFSRHNVIVGRPERPSPVVMTPIATVKFNPYWNAPISIVERDILPKMASGTQVLTQMNMKVFEVGPNGQEVDPNTIQFTPANLDKYLFRQEPGPHSAMATAKVEFQSTFGIYLHDTPEPQLFKSSNRFFSSGCIRVEKMPMLAEWILNGQDGFNAPKIASMAETLERLDVPVSAGPQLRVAYLTAWPTAGGTVAFRKDVYQMDQSGFTIGQPMPVGEQSPDGLRYVLKPLPRLVAEVNDTGSNSIFTLFGKKSSPKTSSLGTLKKNIFGASLSTSKSDPNNFASVSEKPKLGKDKKPIGLFNWAAYKKVAASPTKSKLKKLAKKSKSNDAIPPEPTISVKNVDQPIPPEPTIPAKKKKRIIAANDVPPKPVN
jgi:L,D-transpeptidase YcbB